MQIASAMRHLHGHSPLLIHRDLKPENIFLTRPLTEGAKGMTAIMEGADKGGGVHRAAK